MRGNDSRFEYPDTAGYPDGMGTLHEGIDDENVGDENDDENDEVATTAEGDLEHFALEDEEDAEGA